MNESMSNPMTRNIKRIKTLEHWKLIPTLDRDVRKNEIMKIGMNVFEKRNVGSGR